MLVSFKATIQNETIRVLGCYAPSSGDDPEFFLECKELLDNSQESHGKCLGDLNTALDPNLDRHYLPLPSAWPKAELQGLLF